MHPALDFTNESQIVDLKNASCLLSCMDPFSKDRRDNSNIVID